MCYSAMVEDSYREYIRMTGAEMDLPQFIEIFGLRASGQKIAIPRAVERWFDSPKTSGERQVKELIQMHRTSTVTELEQELFKQKKR